MLLAIIIVALGLLIGLALIALGVRGRRINDHPICLECGFDLIGVIAAARVCPECGVKFMEPTRFQFGQRERRTRLIVAGVVMLLLPAPLPLLFVGGAPVYVAIYTPGAWLPRLSESTPEPWAKAFVDELRARHAAGTLSDAALLAAARSSLQSLQRDRTKWDVASAVLIEDAFDKRLLSDEEAGTFLDEVYKFRLDIAPPVEPGVVSYIVWVDYGLGWSPRFGGRLANVALVLEPLELTVDGEPAAIDPMPVAQVIFFASRDPRRYSNNRGSMGALQGTASITPRDGSATVSLRVRVRFDDSLAPDQRPQVPNESRVTTVQRPLDQPRKGAFTHIIEPTLDDDVTLIAASTEAYERVTDAEIGRELVEALALTLDVGPPDPTTGERWASISSTTRIDTLPAAVISRVELWSGEQRMGRSGMLYPMIPDPMTRGLTSPPDPTRWKIPADIDPRTLRIRLVPEDPVKHARFAVEGALKRQSKLKVYADPIEPRVRLKIAE